MRPNGNTFLREMLNKAYYTPWAAWSWELCVVKCRSVLVHSPLLLGHCPSGRPTRGPWAGAGLQGWGRRWPGCPWRSAGGWAPACPYQSPSADTGAWHALGACWGRSRPAATLGSFGWAGPCPGERGRERQGEMSMWKDIPEALRWDSSSSLALWQSLNTPTVTQVNQSSINWHELHGFSEYFDITELGQKKFSFFTS